MDDQNDIEGDAGEPGAPGPPGLAVSYSIDAVFVRSLGQL